VSDSRSKKIEYPRALAIRVLTRVLSDKQPLDEALANVSGEVSPAALGWLQDVCAGTLRWKGRLDWVIDSVALKKKPSGWLRKALLIAAYQLIAQDRRNVGAVVSETVDLIKDREGKAPAHFANACLRKVGEHAQRWRNWSYPAPESAIASAGQSTTQTAGQSAPQSTPQSTDDKQALQKEILAWASFPDWLWYRLVKQHGLQWAQAYAQASLERPELWIRSRNSEWKPEWAKEGPVPNSWQSTEGGGIVDRSGFKEGQFIVQDISSQILIAEITARVKAQFRMQSVKALDLCAAPGGKSIGMAWNGFEVTSTDRNAHRIPILQQSVSRAAPEIRVESWEQVDHLGRMDFIWIDAPCSGTGILRRHPDVRWLRKEDELKGLMETQRKLLRETWEKVPPGGFLAYSVCSVLREEGPEAILSVGLENFKVQEWFLCPHLAPFGDGFWAALFYKNPA
jgi:16S rRNA (cytosine967-C5)-methyltransferase